MRSAGSPRAAVIASWFVLGITILLAFGRAAAEGWPNVFDDAFITYRYAKNLAFGDGITWNAGQPPTEGYTNFLLVLFLAPWIRIGADPLLVTRVLSYTAISAIAGTLFVVARRRWGASNLAAGMVASAVLLAPEAKVLPLTGLETVIYAFLLLLALLRGARLIEQNTTSHAIAFAALLFATALLRPEAALLFPAVAGVYLVARSRGRIADLKPLLLSIAVLATLTAAYAAWKIAHFHALLPNPFFVKAAGSGIVSQLGIASVRTFITGHAVLLACAFLGLAATAAVRRSPESPNTPLVTTGAVLVVLYGLFFARTDTLMDIHGRFLFPLVPIAALMATPALAAALTGLDALAGPRVAPLCATLAFVLAFGTADLAAAFSNARRIATAGRKERPAGLMASELRVAQALAQYPQITAVRMAFADAGVIPYYTGAPWLDVVGLNDSVLARTTDRSRAIDYFFNWTPDVIIHPGSESSSWIRHGHGPLGDYSSWAEDPRWDAYEYVGTTRTSGRYDLQYFVRRSSRLRETLVPFLRSRVVDGWYEPFPLPIGTYAPTPGAAVQWVPGPPY
ncbi:MAG: hypothetical protein ACRD1U_07230 [Vicinamibacterales bacterium]